MTDNEIIKALKNCINGDECDECPINPHVGNYGYCTNLALREALKLIERQKAEIEKLKYDNCICAVQDLISDMPEVDVVEVVRCKDCKYCIDSTCYLSNLNKDMIYSANIHLTDKDDYCSYGERREEQC